ncbi:phage tail protein I [Burkholderia sp. SCN-KJ]|uniref:phage tail protein I n=1 Tax=Burkholderia sp. SCN-KJ TaxID=2969248 RepID=UPI0021506B5D|nr:phage tail protein I [Burkholderia sp. SCN-KJ]MCR4465850.1 phage tail protein I [Burkholderia sp. SCN-KJ]
MTDLLPPNATPLERSLARVGARISDIPVPIDTLMDPDRIPLALLPWLAWHLGVDTWDAAWPEERKRGVVRNAIRISLMKGTIAAVRHAIEPVAQLIEVIEWWQETPLASRGTFRLRVGVLDSGITEIMHAELLRLINSAKPASRHLAGLDVVLVSRGPLHLAAASYDGDMQTVYPYTPKQITATGYVVVGGGTHVIDTLTTRP